MNFGSEIQPGPQRTMPLLSSTTTTVLLLRSTSKYDLTTVNSFGYAWATKYYTVIIIVLLYYTVKSLDTSFPLLDYFLETAAMASEQA